MIIEYIMPLIDGIMDIFTQGGIITYIILFVGIYGLIIALRKIAYLRIKCTVIVLLWPAAGAS